VNKSKWIIFDIDGTLADISHRLHHIKGDKKDWNAFNSGIMHDAVKKDIKELYIICEETLNHIAIVTGRFEKYRKETEKWLLDNLFFYDELHMRPDDDYSSDYIIKEMIWEKNFRNKNRDIVFIVDDRQQVVDMWRSKGITCLQCQKGDY